MCVTLHAKSGLCACSLHAKSGRTRGPLLVLASVFGLVFLENPSINPEKIGVICVRSSYRNYDWSALGM